MLLRGDSVPLAVELPGLLVGDDGGSVRRPLCVHPDRLDHPVDADAAGQLQDGADRVLAVEVDRLRVLPAGQVEPVRDAVDDDDAPRSLQPRARDRGLPDRTGAHHGHGVTAADLREPRTEPGGRVDVRQHDGLGVVDRLGQRNEPHVGERDPGVLGLEAVETAGALRPAEEDGPAPRRVGVVALGVVARPAVAAGAAGDGGRHHHAVPGAEVPHLGPHLGDDADRLVAEDAALLHVGHGAPDEVQVGTADRRGGDADDRVVRVLDGGVRHVVQTDVADGVPYNGLHERVLRVRRFGAPPGARRSVARNGGGGPGPGARPRIGRRTPGSRRSTAAGPRLAEQRRRTDDRRAAALRGAARVRRSDRTRRSPRRRNIEHRGAQ